MNPVPLLGKSLRIAGGISALFGIALLVVWLGGRSSDRHGAAFVLIGGLFLSLGGAAAWTIGYALTMTKRSPRPENGA